MAIKKSDEAALRAAQDVIKRGQAIGDQSVLNDGLRAQGNILGQNGISYNGGSVGSVGSVNKAVTTPTATNLPYTGGTPTVTKLPYTGGTATPTQYAGATGINYDQAYMSPEDYAIVQSLKDSWADNPDANHAAVELYRKKYGYSGGEDGSQYIPVAPEYGVFEYEAAPTRTDPYSDQLTAMVSQILNRSPFSYNAESDPLYQQYQKQYRREGERAMQDTLGQVSARTGGMASSYAVTAAQQANDYYNAQLADKIPELYKLAYSMYVDEGNQMLQNYNLVKGISDTEYNRWRDDVKDWDDNRDFAYKMFGDDITRQQYANEWIHKIGRENISDAEKKDTTDYTRGRDATKDAYDKAWAVLESGAMPDDEQLKAAGISAEQAAAILAYQKAKALKSSSSSSTKDPYALDFKQVEALLEGGTDSEYLRSEYKKYTGTDWVDPNKKPVADPFWDSVNALGLGPITASAVQEIAQYGGIVENDDETVSWAPGWDKDNYKELMEKAKQTAVVTRSVGEMSADFLKKFMDDMSNFGKS